MPVPTVVALIAAFNEGDIIGQVIEHLASEGVDVYLLDDGSTDDTVRVAETYVGRGVIGIERLAPANGGAEGSVKPFDWTAILRRKEALARSLAAGWFIHHDADEFRESPWPHVTLAEALSEVDARGYNAVDFQLFNFWPTTAHPEGGRDVRQSLPEYEPGETWNRTQVKCWKNLGVPVDLAASGGHDVQFAGRTVCPIRFVLRHYPIRSEAHGRRKVLDERLPRFLPAERERGWHVQYEGLTHGGGFLRDPQSLRVYDSVRARFDLALRHRGVEALETDVAGLTTKAAGLTSNVADLQRVLEIRETEVAHARQVIADQAATVREIGIALESRNDEAGRARQVLADQDAALTVAKNALEMREQEAVHTRQVIADTTADLRTAQAVLAERDEEARHARSVLTEQAGMLHARDAAIAAQEAALAARTLALKEASDAVVLLQKSLSWRLTAPLRHLGRWLGWKR
jgi:hypothetical protein